MLKKVIALSLICAMLVPLSPAVAADETTVTPTIEEILNSYHNKAFEAQAAAENGDASTYARGGSNQTLEQETVAELTAAGYEAYNVTGENYEALEETLNTDFAELGLDPECSYVVVISGEDPATQSNSNARVIDPPTHEDFDGDNGGGGNNFTYTQGGTTYTMRYVTVTATDAYSDLFKEAACTLSNVDYAEEIMGNLIDYTLDLACEKVVEELIESAAQLIPYIGTICSIASMVADVQEAVSVDPFTVLDPNVLVIFSATAWTRSYIQVYDSASGYWKTAQCSSYAYSKAHFDGGYYYNPETNQPQEFVGILKDTTTYSPYYNYPAQQKARAVEGYLNNCTLYDCTGDIDFYFSNPNASHPSWQNILLFTHQESTAQLIPDREEG